MSTITVKAPNAEFTGVVAGIAFANGEGKVDSDNTGAVAYFKRAGYTVGGKKASEPRVGPGTQVQVHDPLPGREDSGEIKTVTEADVAPPPRTGAGSGKDNWVEFAVSKSVPREEAEAKSRDELIAHLEGLDVIPTVQES